MSKDRDTIYIVNKYSELLSFNRKGVRYQFPYNVPVSIDYTEDPGIISELLRSPELRPATFKEVDAYYATSEESEVENILDKDDEQ